jgi:hypothetical protein
MILGSEVYAPVANSEVHLETNGFGADLALFRIARDPNLPDIAIRSSIPAQEAEIIMIGHGRSRGAALLQPCNGRDGWEWVGPSTMRWGTNRIHLNGIDFWTSGTTLTRAFSTRFDAGLPTPHEAQAATGDSGGAVFAWNPGTAEWELAGIMLYISVCQQKAAVYQDLTYSADLSFYFDQIDAIASVPACNDGIDQDGDGRIDHPDDPGCADPLDPFETSDAPACDDGLDNDGDGLIDADDPDCAGPEDPFEAPDADGDGVADGGDNCVAVANGPWAGSCYGAGTQIDSDGDGHGNPCDGDFNNDGVVNGSDIPVFIPDLGLGSPTPGAGTDMDCDAVVNSRDILLFGAQLGLGLPGP